MPAPIPTNEAARLEALRQCDILDTPPEAVYDDITRLATQVCRTPIATITLVDRDRQWFKSAVGMDTREGPREDAFCAHTILQRGTFVVPDAARDGRFRDNPSVTGPPYIRFYAGVPLVTSDGFALGSLCVIDRVSRRLTRQQKAVLEVLARQAAGGLESQRRPAREERLLSAAEGAGVGTYHWDLVGKSVVWSDRCRALFGLPADAAMERGSVPERIHPDDREAATAALRAAVDGGPDCDVEYRVLWPDGTVHWIASRGHVQRDERGAAVGMEGVVFDMTERKAAEEALRRQAERGRFLADLAERARVLTDPDAVVADAVRSLGEFLGVDRCVFVDIDIAADTCTAQPDYRADESVVSMAGTFPISAFGAAVVAAYAAGWAVAVDDVRDDPAQVPPGSVAAYDAVGIRAHVSAPVVHSDRLVSCIGVHSAAPRRWEAEEVALVQAVVERTWLTVEVLRQQRALAREAEALREAHARTAGILESISDAFFALDAGWHFTYVNDQADRIMSRGRAEVMGRVFWEVFPQLVGTVFDAQYHRALAEQVSVAFETFYPTLDAWLEVRAYPSADGLSVFFHDISDRKRTVRELTARVARESLLNQIGQAIRGTLDPAAIQQRAADLLGEALAADRCFYVTYDLTGDRAHIAQDWRRHGLPSLAGDYRASDFETLLGELFPAQRTAVVEDVRASFSPAVATAFEASQHRAVLVVPFFDGGNLVAGLYSSMADAPRRWMAEEVTLVEQVATLTRTTLEAAHVSRRERAIAQQLQDALQPDLPTRVPGLSVGRFTQPALDEAKVGGDFYDVFPLDAGVYALVLGDVSGKGLAAAQQLALVRNSLRATLYLHGAPARAAAALNAIVTAHDLLVGFVTAFVGVYDAVTGEIAYCSCGHEPALVQRAGGAVEALGPTGPPLGISERAEYGEQSVSLEPGDALLLYTDGLSETGPSRLEMLGTEGLMRLLGALPAGLDAQAQAEALVGEVSAYTRGIFRDDVAVLLARRP